MASHPAWVHALAALNSGTLEAPAALEQASRELDGASPDPSWALVAALALWQLKRYGDAYGLCRAYPATFEQSVEALVLKGMVARRLPAAAADAEAAFREAIAREPQRVDALYNLGNLLNDAQRYEQAIPLYERCLTLHPDNANHWHNYGIALRELNRVAEAERALQLALQLDPRNPDIWCNIGLVAHNQERFEQAKACYRQSIDLDSHHSSSWHNLGQSLLDQARPEEALPLLRRGCELDPVSSDALFNVALTELLLGNYRDGWRLYEGRFATKQFNNTLVPSTGPWLNSLQECQQVAATGQQILIWSEQGIGDMIQFVRFIGVLQALELPVAFASRKPLIPLFKQWLIEAVPVLDQDDLPAEWQQAPHLPLMSLPALLGTEMATIPAHTPYLQAPGPPPTELYVAPPPGGLSIGLVWASNPENQGLYRKKSLPLTPLLQRLLPAVQHQLIELHSLQVGADADQFQPWLQHQGIKTWSSQLGDFAATAHVVRQLDLIISVDTAVAHLAGALHQPTWLLLPASADFRWLHQQIDCPWYSSMRLFRQASPGDWPSVVDSVVDTLGEVLGLDLDQLADLPA